MKHGLGLNHFPDGGKYEGEFNNGCINGWVRLTITKNKILIFISNF